MQDRSQSVTMQMKKNTLDWLYFLLWFPPNVTLISYLFPMSVSLKLTNITEVPVVKNK